MQSRSVFGKYLKEEELILWEGQPKRGIQIRDADIILIPMSIILFGFSLILNYNLFHYHAAIFLDLLGLIMATGSIYMGVIRFFVDATRRTRIFYCITSKRVIVLTAKKNPRIKTLPLKNIDQMDITEEKDGSGFIIFGATNPLYPWLLGGFYFSHETVPGLELLPDVKLVYRIITEQVKISITPSLSSELRKEEQGGLN